MCVLSCNASVCMHFSSAVFLQVRKRRRIIPPDPEVQWKKYNVEGDDDFRKYSGLLDTINWNFRVGNV